MNIISNSLKNINCIIKKINIQDIVRDQDYDFETILENYLLIYYEYCNNIFLINNDDIGKKDSTNYNLIEIIYPLNEHECKEVQILNNNLFTLSNYSRNKNVFLIWDLTVLDIVQISEDSFINNRFELEIPLVKQINVDIGGYTRIQYF